jgi:hemoglobin
MIRAGRQCGQFSRKVALMNSAQHFGHGDASFRAAGGQTGIFALVNAFFDRMGSDDRFSTIWEMHPDDKDTSRDKLSRFLCGWLGGPKLYNEKYGAIGIPRVHAHLPIGLEERDQWLTCMTETVEAQPFATEFKTYLMEQLFVPAEAVRRRCESSNT